LFSHGQQVIQALTDEARGQTLNTDTHNKESINLQ